MIETLSPEAGAPCIKLPLSQNNIDLEKAIWVTKRTREQPELHQSCTALGDRQKRILTREGVVTKWKESPKRLSGIKAQLLHIQFCIPPKFSVDFWTTHYRSIILLQIFFFD